jgi:hypothetical protein
VQRLIELSRNREQLATMRVAAFERGGRNFTIGRFLDETLAAYAAVGNDMFLAKSFFVS